MDQRLSFITLAVRDFDATRRFYVDGLGWQPMLAVNGEVLMFPVADRVILSLWSAAGFEAEVGRAPVFGDEAARTALPITLAHNLPDKSGVNAVLAEARKLGAEIVGPEERDWGGYSGYFSDPDGFRWEVCFNPGETGAYVL